MQLKYLSDIYLPACLSSKQAASQKHFLFSPSLQDHLHFSSSLQRRSSGVTAMWMGSQAVSPWPGGSHRMLEQSPSGTKGTALAAGSALGMTVSCCFSALVTAMSRCFSTFLFGTSFVYLCASKSFWNIKVFCCYNICCK